ncbi:amino acid ABC transporter permease [Pseudotabrizicola algicola]|uniref:ABC transporter permease subunit n=1 Tax=Pseudotabrizicola algicola TaxID=2709381 RepID=A0A6B3RNA5_9RHOB|nr:ABC transporter permease subunit [Pseudotabrizicola algicola]NEX46921.1 ABC transporter permease subunit [Pseudotabrizicola algicola]
MAVVTEEPKAGFRLGMLIYDTRYRSITIQIVVLFLVMLGAAWLIDNLLRNLAALGRGIDFGFLWNRAGYDINQTLVEYTNDSTHARATLVGLLNTLLIAFLGCVAATVLGVIAGVLRLSKNWVVARLMTVYVEIFRNIPLLLWILMIYTVFTEALPAPNAFRGENPAASMALFDTVAFTNRYTAIPWLVFDRSLGWLQLGPIWLNLDFTAIIVALVGGFLINRAILKRATRIQEATGVRPTTWWQSLLALFGPIIVLKFALGTHFDYPSLQGFNFTGGLQVSNSLVALWLALTLYTAAFIAEIVRAGINAISRGQSEAAFALGLRPGRTMSLIILPQAMRVIIPPLISQYLNLTKNSSLAIAVGYMDLRGTLGGITLNQTGRGLEAMLLLMLIYLIISLTISSAMNVYNQSVKLKER